MVKTATLPLIAAERFYRKNKELVKHILLYNTENIRTKRDMILFAKDMDSHREGKLFFLNGFPIVSMLSKNTDIVLSHQNGCALNYLYFDAAWLGFPVVHNAHMVKELGYYYEGFDAEAAADQLVYVAKNFDNEKAEYLKKSREYISKFLPDHPRNVKGYEKLIAQVMKS